MKPYDLVGLYIYPNEGEINENLEVYVTEPGEEYYIHIYVWRVMPFHLKLDASAYSVDLAVKKIVADSDKDCDARSDYDYIGMHYSKLEVKKIFYIFFVNQTRV